MDLPITKLSLYIVTLLHRLWRTGFPKRGGGISPEADLDFQVVCRLEVTMLQGRGFVVVNPARYLEHKGSSNFTVYCKEVEV